MLYFIFTNLWVAIISFFSSLPIDAKSSEPNAVVKWSVEKNSTLRILGSSNLHDFQCDALGYAASDTINFIPSQHSAGRIPLKGFFKNRN